jgi:sugar-specific transcriptional regulator TrmB
MVIKQDLINILKRLGLNEYESKAYLALLTSGVCTASKLSESAAIPRPRVYDVLDSLREKGFVVETPGRPVEYKALTPGHVANLLKKKKEEELTSNILEIEELASRFQKVMEDNPEKAEGDITDKVWAIKGRRNIYAQFSSMIEGSKDIKIFTTTEGLKAKLKLAGKSLTKAKERGATVRIIAPSDPKTEHVKNLASVRNIENEIVRFGIFDGKESLFILTPEKDSGTEVGLWVSSPTFTHAINEMFEQKWKEAYKA